MEERRRGTSYISEEPKSVRERYILVEAIDIVIREGVWNIYIAESVRNRCPILLIRTRTYKVVRI
jgi:hypothetical protein